MRNRWSSNYSKRSVKRWHRLPTIQARVYPTLAVSNKGQERTFTGLTWRHADRRADRWLSTR